MGQGAELVVAGEGGAASLLAEARFQQLAEVPTKLEWFGNLDKPRNRRAYQGGLREFVAVVGIEFNSVVPDSPVRVEPQAVLQIPRSLLISRVTCSRFGNKRHT